jgi:hypothetical protein
MTRSDLDQALSERRELAIGERVGPRDRGAHPMHQPERGGVENETHLIGGRAMTRHAIRRQLRLVLLDQVLHLPALAVNVLVKVLRRAFERGDDMADVDLLAHAGLSCDGCSEHSSRATTLRGCCQLPALYMKLTKLRSFGSPLVP